MVLRGVLAGALCATLLGGCKAPDADTDTDSDGAGDAGLDGPSLTMLIPSGCGRSVLPVPTRAQLGEGATSAPVTVTATGLPGGAEVEFFTTAGALGFMSNVQPSIETGRSLPHRLANRQAFDDVFCLRRGTHEYGARLLEGGEPAGLETTRRISVRCVTMPEYESECGDDPPPDASAPPDGAIDAGMEPDANPFPDAAPVPVPAWDFEYVGAEGNGRFFDLTFRAEADGGPLEGADVAFEVAGPQGVALSTREGATDAAGEVTVRLHAGGVPGPATVTATAFWRDEQVQAHSDVLQIGGGAPSHHGFTFACDARVLPAFERRFPAPERWPEPEAWPIVPGAETRCTAQITDRLQGRVSNETRVLFLTEAGNLDQQLPTDGEGRATSTLRVGEPAPADVEPWEYEIAAGFDGEFNPRDGLVRVVALTLGEEAFVDVNGDGVWDEAVDFQHPHQQLSEVFLDINDDDEFDDGVEFFRDANGNGDFDYANDQWDEAVEIWVSTTVLWVGDLRGDDPCDRLSFRCLDDHPEGCEPGADGAPPTIVAPGGRFEIRADLSDDNGNCLGGLGEGRASIAIAGAWDLRGEEANVPLRERCFDAPRGFPRPEPLAWTLISRLAPADEPRDVRDELTVRIDYRRAGGEPGSASCLVDLETRLPAAD